MGKLKIFTCSPLITRHTNGGAMWICLQFMKLKVGITNLANKKQKNILEYEQKKIEPKK